MPFVYTSFDGDEYEINDDCPICHGKGYIEDINAKPEYVFDDEQWIFLKDVPFSSLIIKRLYEALDIICVDEANIIRLGYNGFPTIIRVNGDIDIVLMALLSNGYKKQKYVLKYKVNGTKK